MAAVRLANGLQARKNIDGTYTLIVESDRLEDYISYVKNGDIKAIEINAGLGYALDNIDFLAELSDVLESVVLLETKVNYGVVNSLHKLEYLGISDNGKDTIDLSNFPRIETLAAEYTSRLKGLGSASSLRNLSLTKYNPKSKNLTELRPLAHLTSLSLFVTTITSLEGIESLANVKRLHIYRAPKLTDLKNLTQLTYIEELELESCKLVSDYGALSKIESLRDLMLLSCGDAPTLHFIKTLNLENFSFWGTNIVDGDLSYLDDMPGIHYVSFDNKRHYTRKMEDFEESNRLYIPKWERESKSS